VENSNWEQIAYLFEQLQQMKHTRNFKKYGFGAGGKNGWWIKRAHALRKKVQSKHQQQIVLGTLQLLATAYAVKRFRLFPHALQERRRIKKMHDFVQGQCRKHGALMPKQEKKSWIKSLFVV